MEEIFAEPAPKCRDVGIQCDRLQSMCASSTPVMTTCTPGYRIEYFMNKQGDLEYLTGCHDYNHFMLLFSVLGPSVHHLKYRSTTLSPENELFLTLMKLRLAKDDMQLHIDFGMDRCVVGKVFNTWINFTYSELSEISTWIPKSVVQEHFPQKFHKMFPAKEVILDATETPINKPKNCNAQCVTFSTYKNRNTAKTMVGISPRGLVTT